MTLETTKINKQRATEMRARGFTFSKISSDLNIPKSTLSYWFRHELYSKEITELNRKKAIVEATIRLGEIQSRRTLALKEKYEIAISDAQTKFKEYLSDPLFIAGICLYIGEGDKQNRTNLIRISNIDPSVLRIFKKFAERYLKIETAGIKFWPLLYKDHDIPACCEWWSKELHIKAENFYKPQVIEGREKRKKLLYGVGNIIIGSKLQKVKLLEWIRLTSVELGDAGMV